MADVIDGDTAKEISFGDLIDLFYLRAELSGKAFYLTVQYATKVEEMCYWHLDVIDDQDIHDAVLFIKGFDASEGYSYLHSVGFHNYDNMGFHGDAKNWKVGGEKWPTDSQAQDAAGS